MHVLMLPGDQSSSPPPCVSRLEEAPLLRHSVPEVTVPVCPLAAPLPSAPAVPGGPWDLVGSWWGTGGEEAQVELGKDPEAEESCAGKDGVPHHAAKLGCAVMQRTPCSQRGFGWGLCSSPLRQPPVTKLDWWLCFRPGQHTLFQRPLPCNGLMKGEGNGSSHQEISAAFHSLDVSWGALGGRRPSASAALYQHHFAGGENVTPEKERSKAQGGRYVPEPETLPQTLG